MTKKSPDVHSNIYSVCQVEFRWTFLQKEALEILAIFIKKNDNICRSNTLHITGVHIFEKKQHSLFYLLSTSPKFYMRATSFIGTLLAFFGTN